MVAHFLLNVFGHMAGFCSGVWVGVYVYVRPHYAMYGDGGGGGGGGGVGVTRPDDKSFCRMYWRG